MSRMKTAAVIVAAGSGTRMGGIGKNKVFLEFGGKSVIERTIEAFENCADIDEIIVVAKEDEIMDMWSKLGKYTKLISVTAGGETRTASTLSGLSRVSNDVSLVAFHDGARPFVTSEIISAAINDAIQYGASIVGVPEIDTVKQADEDGFVTCTLPRQALWRIQTPQVFKVEEFINAVNSAETCDFTDDSAFIEAAGGKVHITYGSYDNIKITTPEDLAVAERILER